jgi:hypothetical protein
VRGFYASNNIAVGAANYGFYSDISDATNTWQLVMDGTAPSRFDGSVGIGGATPTSSTYALRVGFPSTISATVSYGIYSGGNANSASTTAAYAFASVITSANTTYTVTTLYHFAAVGQAAGSGSTVTNVRGFSASNVIAIGTNNYGFYSDIDSATTTYQLYMGGTALNFLKGGVILDTTAAPTVGASQVGLGATTSSTVGAAGGASAPPATPDGYWVVNIAGTDKKIPYYAT